MESAPRLRLLLSPLILAVVAAGAEPAGTSLPKKSPFEPRGGPSAPAPAANETIEFAGVSSVGKRTDLIFYDKTAKKSHWIGEGETKEGISVVDYDERREEVTVKINGVQKTLALRKASSPVNSIRPVVNLPPTGFNTPPPTPATLPAAGTHVPAAPMPLPAVTSSAPTAPQPAPAAPPPAGTPAEIQARQETEARMLVSDLLEIGMAQRRAYEEAQRRAAEGNTQTSPTSDPSAPQAAPAAEAQR